MRRQSTPRGAADALLTGRLDEDWAPSFSRSPRRGRLSRRGNGGGSAADHKAMQLCHQVAITLDEVLAECGDSLLQGLRVLDVKPAPDISRLLVTLTADGVPVESLPTVETHLAKASRHLRGEVAQAITRKRAPSLVYVLAPGENGA